MYLSYTMYVSTTTPAQAGEILKSGSICNRRVFAKDLQKWHKNALEIRLHVPSIIYNALASVYIRTEYFTWDIFPLFL